MSRIVVIDYTNWRGERRRREVCPLSWRYGSSVWHAEKQWLMRAIDMEDKGSKEFAVKDIHAWEPTPWGIDEKHIPLHPEKEASA